MADIDRNTEIWGKVVRKLTRRQMPPKDSPRPLDASMTPLFRTLNRLVDSLAAKNPNPGRTETFRRLNRTEYQNTIRDLLALDIDATALLAARMSRATASTISRSPICRRRC